MHFIITHRFRWYLAPLLGVLATLGYAPYGQWYLSLLALALLFLIGARSSPWRSALLGWLYGFTHYATGIYWVYISTHVYGGAPAWLGVVLAAALSAYLATYDALALGLASRFGLLRSRTGWFAVPALWVLLEMVRGHWVFQGFPWLSYGELAVDTPVAKLAPLVGVHGLSAVAVLCAFALYRLAMEHHARGRAVAAAAFVSPLLALALPPPSSWTQLDGPAFTAALVQSDIHQDEKWLPEMRFEALSRHWRLTQQAWPASLVVWPEVALTQAYDQLKDGYLASLDAQARARNATIMLGILVFDEGQKSPYNSVVSVGAEHGRYDKRHLVPFGEFFPIPDFLRPLMVVLGTPYTDLPFGKPDQPLLAAAGQKVDVSICFEDAFGNEVAARAGESGVLVNLTNDAWFGRSSAPHQHLQYSRLRAMENGRWFLRAANTGISAIISPDGEVVQRSKQFEQAVLRGDVQPRRGLTPYQQWGDAPLWVLAPLLLAAALLWRRLRKPAPLPVAPAP